MRPLPELADRNYRVRQAAERQAMNAGIQGLAADLFKTALVRLTPSCPAAAWPVGWCCRSTTRSSWRWRPVRRSRCRARSTTAALTGAAALSVPLKVSLAFGPSWAAAKGG